MFGKLQIESKCHTFQENPMNKVSGNQDDAQKYEENSDPLPMDFFSSLDIVLH